jgi:hypothetical protein
MWLTRGTSLKAGTESFGKRMPSAMPLFMISKVSEAGFSSGTAPMALVMSTTRPPPTRIFWLAMSDSEATFCLVM